MMLINVPRRTQECIGIGTVAIVPSGLFYMIRWLPRRRTAWNPSDFEIRQTSSPERTRSLPNRDLDLGDKNFRVETLFDLARVGGFKEQSPGLDQIGAGLLDRVALTGDVQIGTQGYKAVVLALDKWPSGSVIGSSAHYIGDDL